MYESKLLTRDGFAGWETRILRRIPAPESSPGSKRALRERTCWIAWDLFQEGLRIPVTTRVSRHSRREKKKALREPRIQKLTLYMIHLCKIREEDPPREDKNGRRNRTRKEPNLSLWGICGNLREWAEKCLLQWVASKASQV